MVPYPAGSPYGLAGLSIKFAIYAARPVGKGKMEPVKKIEIIFYAGEHLNTHMRRCDMF